MPVTAVPLPPRSEPAAPGAAARPPLFSRGLRFMAAGAFFFSVMSLLVKLVGQRLPTQEIVLVRSVIVAVLAGTAVRRAHVGLVGRPHGLLVLRGLLGFGSLSCFYYALVHLPLADANVLQYTNAIFASIFAVFVLGESVRTREAGALALSMSGVLLIAQPSFVFGVESGLNSTAVAVGLTGAVMSGGAYVTIRRLGGEHHMLVILYFAVVSIIGSLPFAFRNAVVPTPWEALLLLGIGFTTHWGQVSITRGLSLERAGRASSVGLIQILFAAVLGLAVFGHVPGPFSLVGAALVITGVLLVARG